MNAGITERCPHGVFVTDACDGCRRVVPLPRLERGEDCFYRARVAWIDIERQCVGVYLVVPTGYVVVGYEIGIDEIPKQKREVNAHVLLRFVGRSFAGVDT